MINEILSCHGLMRAWKKTFVHPIASHPQTSSWSRLAVANHPGVTFAGIVWSCTL